MQTSNMMDENNNSHKKILVVDDNLLNRKLACAILKNNDFSYDIAENGKIAYDLFVDGSYDVVLMDIQMPIMNGIESTKKIREFERQTKVRSSVPIIAVTTFTRDSDKQNCYEAEMNEVLGKPYKTSSLLEVLDRYL